MHLLSFRIKIIGFNMKLIEQAQASHEDAQHLQDIQTVWKKWEYNGYQGEVADLSIVSMWVLSRWAIREILTEIKVHIGAKHRIANYDKYVYPHHDAQNEVLTCPTVYLVEKIVYFLILMICLTDV